MRYAAQRVQAIDYAGAGWLAGAALASVAAGLLVAARPAAAFDATVLAGCAVLAGRRPYAALAVVLVIRASFARSVLFDFVVLGAGTVALLAIGRGLPGKRVALPLLAFLLLALPSIPLLPSYDEGLKPDWLQLPVLGFQYARNPSSELLEWIRLASLLVAFLWAASCIRSAQRLRWLVALVLISAVHPILFGLRDLAAGRLVERGGFDSIQGPFTNPNYFASYLTIVLVVAIVAFLDSRSLAVRGAVALLIAGGLTCLFFTYTRTAWIGFAAALLVVTALRYRRLVAGGAVVLVLAILVAPGATHHAQQRFADLSTSSPTYTENSWSWRKAQWRRMIPYGLERPATGRGFGSYFRDTVAVFGLSNRDFSTQRKGATQPLGFGAHNDYVKALVETGVPGLALWLLVLFGLVSVAARARRVAGAEPYATAVLGVTVALAGMSFADNVEASAASILYAFALCGGLAGMLVVERGRDQRAPGVTASSRVHGKRASSSAGDRPRNSLR